MIKKVKEHIQEKQDWEKAYKSWMELGFCEEMTEEESVALIKKLEEAAQMMLKSQPSVVDTLLIPIIVRCYRAYKYLVKDVIAVKIHIEKRIFLLHELSSSCYSNMDAEAEFCGVISNEIYQLKL